MNSDTPRLDGRSWALLLALSLLWSGSFIFIKIASAEVPVLTLVLVRVGLAAIVLHAVVLTTGRRYPSEPGILLHYVAMGLFNNVLPFALIVYATVRIGAGAASILNAMSPIFTLLVAHLVTADEKITPAKLIGILLGVAGVAAMVGPQALAGLTGNVTAAGAMLLASIFYGIAAIIGRSFKGIDPTVSATCQLSASTLLLLPVVLMFEGPGSIFMPSPLALGSAIALAVLSTALAYAFYFELIARAGATNAILVTIIIPAGTVLFAWGYLGETFTPDEAAGMFLIGVGLVVIDGRALRRLRRSTLSGAPVRPEP